jgi:hypothetical protein
LRKYYNPYGQNRQNCHDERSSDGLQSCSQRSSQSGKRRQRTGFEASRIWVGAFGVVWKPTWRIFQLVTPINRVISGRLSEGAF